MKLKFLFERIIKKLGRLIYWNYEIIIGRTRKYSLRICTKTRVLALLPDIINFARLGSERYRYLYILPSDFGLGLQLSLGLLLTFLRRSRLDQLLGAMNRDVQASRYMRD